MSTKTVTARVPTPLETDLERLAAATRRSKTYHVTRALEEYLEREHWQLAAVAVAIADDEKPGAERISHAGVSTWLRSWETPEESSPP
ncbi:MAG: ribbon-helix-helix domain-containing protein [Candidatus Baltobacteraceae bacterium]